MYITFVQFAIRQIVRLVFHHLPRLAFFIMVVAVRSPLTGALFGLLTATMIVMGMDFCFIALGIFGAFPYMI
jgi:hypothetical protein